jgi:hypothetical protein
MFLLMIFLLLYISKATMFLTLNNTQLVYILAAFVLYNFIVCGGVWCYGKMCQDQKEDDLVEKFNILDLDLDKVVPDEDTVENFSILDWNKKDVVINPSHEFNFQ